MQAVIKDLNTSINTGIVETVQCLRDNSHYMFKLNWTKKSQQSEQLKAWETNQAVDYEMQSFITENHFSCHALEMYNQLIADYVWIYWAASVIGAQNVPPR